MEDIREQTKNLRTGVFELDSVYGDPAPKDSEDPRKMLIGEVSKVTGNQNKPKRRPPETGPKKANENDLPREPRNEGDFIPLEVCQSPSESLTEATVLPRAGCKVPGHALAGSLAP